MMQNKFKGIWPAMLTPVDEQGQPAFDQIEKLAGLFVQQGLDGLYLLGSTGQGLLFKEEERMQICEVVLQTTGGKIPVIVHVGALTTAESIRLAKQAEKAGADGISSVGPVYYSGKPEMALNHYRQIAQATELPFFPYQLGGQAIPGGNLDFIGQLMAMPNVKGMKLTTSGLFEFAAIHNYAGDRLTLFSGADELFCHAALCGSAGAIGTFYNLWGPACKTVREGFLSGNVELAKAFMLAFQRAIRHILPNIWTFLRQAMQYKYQIEIGHTRAPLGNTNENWNEAEVIRIIEEIDSIAGN